jgi:putative mRNA 3-end processing factor
VLATPETIAIMQQRYGKDCAGSFQPVRYGETVEIGGVRASFYPAGHILGSAQILLEHKGERIVVSGDYKRAEDPTCQPFEPIKCDIFVTEATFALPVFQHPNPDEEIRKLTASVAAQRERTHVIGCYSLGKCQRVIALLRRNGYDAPIYLHGAHEGLCNVYQRLGVPLGDLRKATGLSKEELNGQIVLAPGSALQDRWARRMNDPVVCNASGWMMVRQRAKQKGVELPLVISDHADWNELCQTIKDVEAPEIWVTHGREDALIHHCLSQGLSARPLALQYEDDNED